jgi:hypothetical protein
LALAGFFFLVVFLVDCYAESTNIMHSVLPFYSLLEVGAWGALIWLYITGEVEGERVLSVFSFCAHLILNVIFTVVHFKFIMPRSSPHYL